MAPSADAGCRSSAPSDSGAVVAGDRSVPFPFLPPPGANEITPNRMRAMGVPYLNFTASVHELTRIHEDPDQQIEMRGELQDVCERGTLYGNEAGPSVNPDVPGTTWPVER